MDKALPFVIVPFCSVFIIFSGWLMTVAARTIAVGVQTRDWPFTDGRVLTVENKDTSDAECSSHEVLVRYARGVAGREYEGTTILRRTAN
ncbi:MAG: hypothetical protein QM775_29060 [Pirellulales bacterium]